MLVLNRRPGESIVIEPDLRVTVLSVADRRVWIGVAAGGRIPSMRMSASVVTPTEARVEIGPLSSIEFDDGAVRIEIAGEEHPASGAHAGIAIDRKLGERILIGGDLWASLTSVAKGNPSITLGGSAIGEELSITLIRPAGSYVRLGVDAPSRKVYREELWDAVTAGASPASDDGGSGPPADKAADAADAADGAAADAADAADADGAAADGAAADGRTAKGAGALSAAS